MGYEHIIKRYFDAWIKNDIEIVKETFSQNIVYSECYGPQYHGLAQIIRWFTEWNEKGRVLEWNIKRTIQKNNILVAEWYFKCNYNNHMDEFDGVTIADFDENMQITRLCEFQSKAEHYYPYGQ